MSGFAHTRPDGLLARAIVRAVARRAPDQVVADEGREAALGKGGQSSASGSGGVYLNRWVIWGRDPNGARLLLHEILRPDADMRLHNHPWRWAVALVISGGYAELRLTDFAGARHVLTWRWPWRIYRLTGTDFHRIAHLKGRASWSLFLHGPRRQRWGFLAPDGETGAVFDMFAHARPPSRPPSCAPSRAPGAGPVLMFSRDDEGGGA